MNKFAIVMIGIVVAGAIAFAVIAGKSLINVESVEDNPEEHNLALTNPGSLTLSVQNVTVNKVDENTTNVQVAFDVHNPTTSTIGLEIIHYNLFLNGTSLTSGDIGTNIAGAENNQGGIIPVLGNSILTLKDTKILQRDNLNSNIWNELISGKASYVIKGIYSYNNEGGLQTNRGQQDYELKYPPDATSNSTFQLVQTIPLSDVTGRIDHMDVDVKGQRLFVAELGNNSVDVIDLKTGQRIHSITGLHEPQGIVFIPDSKKIFVANGGDGTVQIFDSDSFDLVKTINISSDADNMRYDKYQNLVYVGYGNGALGIIDPTQENLVDSIKLDGHPESFQISDELEPGIFVNVPGDNSIAVVDGQKRTVTAKWSNDGASSNYVMALDEDSHRLFVGYRDPSELFVINTDSGKTVTKLNIVGDPDDIFYDNQNKQIYVSGGEGSIDVVAQQDADNYHEVAKILSAQGARTSLFVPQLNQLFVAAPNYADQEAKILVYQVSKIQ